ncbi:blue copper protein [Brachypodium distachyon]|uniref:Phytocyanin domain-containing protein n=1 Tax=Brachypodium distachyon TaxID=15368 RepID=I1HEM5_BRADI|nr:blue copper protein [Brachypodium distachyon]KQK03975.1 hypothetical protein BRADI_2g10960v3 [Brachypodium distachyon]|eukprot:XP_003567403.1 blue copper protein [Brachypodium distachyon]
MLFSGRRRGLQTAVPCLFVMAAVLSAGAVEGYKNYTVGEGKGWYDGGAVDYQAWADGYNFSLGDFLIFNTDKNHSVVQTRNETLYKSCDYENSGPEDTVDWSAAPEFSKDAVTAAVPLLKEGDTYFFSGNYDGEQCLGGQRFAIAVAHGQGLPPDLRPPSAEASGPAPGPEAQGIADAVPAFDFSHPKNVSTPSLDKDASDDETSSDSSGSSLTLAGLGPGLVMVLTVLFGAQV